MSEPSFLQRLTGEAAGFLEFVQGLLTEDSTRRALAVDLGGKPAAAATAGPFPTAKLASIKQYAASAEPTPGDDAKVLADIATALDMIASNVETWQAGPVQGGQELGHALLQLLSTTYARHRWPRLFLWIQFLSALEEAVSTYGPGADITDNTWQAMKKLWAFIIEPGKTLGDLDDPGQDSSGQAVDYAVDTTLRLAAAVVGVYDGIQGIEIIGDTLSGWDTPGLDKLSPDVPTRADVLSSRMVSFSLARDTDDLPTRPEEADRLQISLMWLPKRQGVAGSFHGLFAAFGGALAIDEPLSDRWTFSFNFRADAGAAAIIAAPDHWDFSGPSDGEFSASAGLTSRPDPASGLSFSVPRRIGTRLEIGTLAAAMALTSTGAEFRLDLADCALVLDAEGHDGFLRRLLPSKPMRLAFGVAVGYNSRTGRILEAHGPGGGGGPGVQNSPLAGDGAGEAPLVEATIPLGMHIGPVTVHEIALRLSQGTIPVVAPDEPVGGDRSRPIVIEADLSFSTQLGPVYLRVDRVGLSLVLDTNDPPAERNLRLVDAQLRIKPPLGIAVQVDNDLISGGGTIFHDPAQGVYFGAFALRLFDEYTLKAIGLVATKNPDGTPGSSFIIIATIEGLGWRLGPVTIDGLGLLYASDRTFDEAAVRSALPAGQLKTVLFPADPVHHTAEVLHGLSTFFPAKARSYLIGLLVRLSFGTPPIVRLDLAVIYQFGDGVSKRLLVLGRISSLLPTESAPIVRINLEAVGVFDPSAGEASLDAVLVDSKLFGRFLLTGGAAFRRVPDKDGFALAIGGFHPDFRAPDGFPALSRVTIALTAGDNPKLICQGYLAVTSNTLQFGANAYLFAAACGFSIEGSVGFDVLLERLPFHFLASFQASIQLKRGSHNLFKVGVSGVLEATGGSLSVRGKATFEICWCDFSVGFDKTLAEGAAPPSVAAVDALAAVTAELTNVRNWRVEPPAAASRTVVVRRDYADAGGLLLHPMGSLSVSQGAVPLNLARDIDRIGAARLASDRRFAITQVKLGDAAQQTTPVREQFAPAQFFDLSDDEKLAAPSFEEMDAGVSFGDPSATFDFAARAASPFDYTDVTVGTDGTAVLEPEPYHEAGPAVLNMLFLGAAALAPARRAGSERFAGGPLAGAPTIRAGGWAVAAVNSSEVPVAVGTWVEARARLRPGHVLVPYAEGAVG